MIVASIAEPTPARVRDRIEEARRQGADAAEVRADALTTPDLTEILAGRTLPLIVTARPSWEGGRWTRSEDERIAVLREAARGGAEYVDVEFKAYKDFDRGRASLIVSWHDFKGTPPNLDVIARKMASLEPAILKIAARADGAADLARLVELQKRLPRPGAVVAMGDFGEPLRVLYRRYGGVLTYASVGEPTASGQLSVAELAQTYDVKSIDDATEVYAVMGDPVAHSKSPWVFNRAFRELGLNARMVRVRLDDVGRFREVWAALELKGASVTIPHKELILERLDDVDDTARKIGAVNTVVAREGRLWGTNTDAPAALESIRGAVARRGGRGVRGLRALVLGAGGAARAIAWALKEEGAHVIVANRTGERARVLAEAIGGETLQWERLAGARASIIVNATSVGMNADVSPYPKESWRAEAVAFDVVYTPRETRFLREAREAGAEVASGVEMFLGQAGRQLRHFVGRDLPDGLVEELRARL
ncbi:MAG: shikimate dehydrogenase [Planctomycetes bacterium]|nr:shikimate dehydrogenase [Planctomycetota bacterium]